MFHKTLQIAVVSLSVAVGALGSVAPFLTQTAFAKEESGTPVTAINVVGNHRVEPETVLSYMTIARHDPYSQEKLDESLKRLYETGLFANVTINRKGPALEVQVAENPIINKVAFEGNKRIKKEDLEAEVSLKSRAVYTKGRLQNDVNRILDIYRKSGRFSVSVVPKVIELPDNRINLVFEIDEGPKTAVSKIYFVGNKAFGDNKLNNVIHTKEAHWYRFFSGNDTYDADRLDFDKELLRKFYTSQGFADFRVVSAVAELKPERDGFIITFTIDEGKKYAFGDVSVEAQIERVKPEEISNKVETKKGHVFNSELIERSIDNITKNLSDRGYAFVDVEPDFDRHPETQVINVRYVVKEGKKVYVNRINVNGNVRTLDDVVRREFRITEGDPYNAAQVRRSEQRIKNLGFFDKVEISNSRTDSPDKVDINVDVQEKSTGEVNFGAGYSTTDGALATAGIRERNLLGKGQDIRLDLQRAQKKTDINLSFTEPYFLDHDFSAGFDVFRITRDLESESSYNSDSDGFVLRGGYDLTEYLRHSVRYSFQQDKITDVTDQASRYIREQEGENTTSSVGQTFMYDKRDNKFNPTEGYYVRLNQDVAGLGGDSKYLRHELRGGYYIPVVSNKVILQLNANTGYIFGLDGNDVRINERFFVGGDDLRGFRTAGIGPRDITTSDSLGGNFYYTGTTELSFPLGLPDELDFTGSIFMDAGSLSQLDSKGPGIVDKNSVRMSVGTGVSWGSPMGPIRIDLAAPVVKESFDRTQIFRFSFGTRF